MFTFEIFLGVRIRSTIAIYVVDKTGEERNTTLLNLTAMIVCIV